MDDTSGRSEHDRPPQPPRSLLVHIAVDAVVSFLAIVVLGLVLGVPIVVIGVIAITLGIGFAPLTRRRAGPRVQHASLDGGSRLSR